MNHSDSISRFLHTDDKGRLLAKRPFFSRAKVLCKHSDCGHPRSEHGSEFRSDRNDYVYGKCKVFGCTCSGFVDETGDLSEALPVEPSLAPAVERCRACGISVQPHAFLSEECLDRCEQNWKELERHKVKTD